MVYPPNYLAAGAPPPGSVVGSEGCNYVYPQFEVVGPPINGSIPGWYFYSFKTMGSFYATGLNLTGSIPSIQN